MRERGRTSRTPRVAATVAVALTSSLLAAFPSQAAPAAGDRPAGAAATGPGRTMSTGEVSVTLVRGDTVQVTELGAGRYGLRVGSPGGAGGVAYTSWMPAATAAPESRPVHHAGVPGPASYTLTIEGLDRQGGDDFDGQVLVAEVVTGELTEAIPIHQGANVVELEVPAGTYAIVFQSFQFRGTATELVDVSLPEVVVDQDTSVVLDGRDALPVTYDVGESTQDQSVTISSYRGTVSGSGGFVASLGASYYESMPVFAAPTEPITVGAYEYFSQWTSDGAEIHYDLLVPEPDAIPVGPLSYEIGPDEVARIDLALHADEGGRDYWTGRIGFRPYGGIGSTGYYAVPAPSVRTDWVSGGDILRFALVDASQSPAFVEIQELLGEFVNGSHVDQRWYVSPVRPAFVPEAFPPTRFEDTLALTAFSFVDADGHVGFADPGLEGPSIDTVSYRLTAGDEVLAEGGELRRVEVPVPPEETAYELTLDSERDAPWWLSSTRTSTTWRFTSATSADPDGTPLPLLQVGYGIDLGLRNEAESPTPVRFDVTGPDATVVTGLEAWWSIDDGATWNELDVTDLGDGSFEGVVAVSDTHAVSLRVLAQDADANEVEQEVIRAYTGVFTEPTATPTTTSPPPTTSGPPPTSTGTPTIGPTTTLPGTGGGNVGWLAAIAIAVIILGAVVVVIARRRLGRPE